jgi:3-isopropylmalate/(R)-2-methylmalate dehydratase large subunit
MAVNVTGRLARGVGAKDLILAIIRQLGFGGGTGYVLEYRGEAIEALDMEQRMTLCNMTIEAGARAGLVAPDETTFAYLKGKRLAPQGEAWQKALVDWKGLVSDPDASFDQEISIDGSTLIPMVTWGTSPDQAIGISEQVPYQLGASEEKALAYMQWQKGQRLEGVPIDVVFVGSCTNGRLSDLRQVAEILRGRQVAPTVRMLVVPGSQAVQRAAEAEGLADVFVAAGAEWREPGCSLCIAMNGDQLEAGQCAVSTSNRNFAGRQGKDSRTILASPYSAAAAAVRGYVCDPRPFLL